MTDTFHGCGLGSFIAFCIATAMFIVGFGSPYWMTTARDHQGLWKYCFVDYNLCEDFIGNNALDVPIPDDLRGAQTLMCLALVSCFLGGLCYLSWITDTHLRAPAGSVIFTLLTGGLVAGGCSVYAAYYGTPTGWAYWMSMSSSPIFMVTGLLTLCTVCQGEDTINRHDYTPEMMYETMPDKRPLMPVQPIERIPPGPPMMQQFGNPMYNQGPVSPIGKPYGVSPMDEKPAFKF